MRTEQEVQAEREALFAQREPIDNRLRELYHELDEVRTARVADLGTETDDQLRELFNLGWSNGSGNSLASQKVEEFFKTFHPTIRSHGWNAQNEAQAYAVPQARLDYQEDATALTEAITALVKRIALGRETVYVDIFEHTLSEHGVYGMYVSADGERASLSMVRYGRESVILEDKPLNMVLKKVAQDYWYEGGPDDDDDDEDYDW